MYDVYAVKRTWYDAAQHHTPQVYGIHTVNSQTVKHLPYNVRRTTLYVVHIGLLHYSAHVAIFVIITLIYNAIIIISYIIIQLAA